MQDRFRPIKVRPGSGEIRTAQKPEYDQIELSTGRLS